MKTSILILITSFLMIGFVQLNGQDEWHGEGTTSGYGIIGTTSTNFIGLQKFRIYNANRRYSLFVNNDFVPTNGDNAVFGIYSKMPNLSNIDSRAAFFEGHTEVKGNFITGGNNGKFIFTYGWQNNDDFLTIAPDKTSTPNDWNWARSFTFDNDGSIRKAIDDPDLSTFVINLNGTTSNDGTTFKILGDGRTIIGRNDDNTDLVIPDGYKLYVKDGILTERIKVALHNDPTNWADYVFDTDYKLMPLKQLKAYIEKNHHLPNIPSTQNLVDNGGVELMEMTRLQMEKIEELTLYLIQMNDKLEKLEKENEALKLELEAIQE